MGIILARHRSKPMVILLGNGKNMNCMKDVCKSGPILNKTRNTNHRVS